MKTYFEDTHQKRIREKYQYFGIDLFKAILSNFFIFIDHKSTTIETDSFEIHFFITCL